MGKVGDEVIAATSPYSSGTHTELCAIPSDWLAHKPTSCSHEEAAAVPYVALTAMSALHTVQRDQKVLLHGGTGGVGMFAVPYLKNLNCEVTVTCSASSRDFGHELGADYVLDYHNLEAELLSNFAQSPRFDLVVDTQGSAEFEQLVRGTWLGGCGEFVTLKSPINSWLTQYGLTLGMVRTAAEYIPMKAASSGAVSTVLEGAALFAPWWARGLKNVVDSSGLKEQVVDVLHPTNKDWAFFGTYGIPSGRVLAEVAKLVDEGVVRPRVHSVLDLEDAVRAHELVEAGSGIQGKVVLRF